MSNKSAFKKVYAIGLKRTVDRLEELEEKIARVEAALLERLDPGVDWVAYKKVAAYDQIEKIMRDA